MDNIYIQSDSYYRYKIIVPLYVSWNLEKINDIIISGGLYNCYYGDPNRNVMGYMFRTYKSGNTASFIKKSTSKQFLYIANSNYIYSYIPSYSRNSCPDYYKNYMNNFIDDDKLDLWFGSSSVRSITTKCYINLIYDCTCMFKGRRDELTGIAENFNRAFNDRSSNVNMYDLLYSNTDIKNPTVFTGLNLYNDITFSGPKAKYKDDYKTRVIDNLSIDLVKELDTEIDSERYKASERERKGDPEAAKISDERRLVVLKSLRKFLSLSKESTNLTKFKEFEQ